MRILVSIESKLPLTHRQECPQVGCAAETYYEAMRGIRRTSELHTRAGTLIIVDCTHKALLFFLDSISNRALNNIISGIDAPV